MAALSADRKVKGRDIGRAVPAKVKASTTVYGGSLVARLTSTGLIQPGADTASTTFAGVLREHKTGNASGTTACEVWQEGDFEFGFSGTATEADCGKLVYLVDDQTVALAATTTNDIACGYITEYVSASKVMVRIDAHAF